MMPLVPRSVNCDQDVGYDSGFPRKEVNHSMFVFGHEGSPCNEQLAIQQ
jgi:hypothetical protein